MVKATAKFFDRYTGYLQIVYQLLSSHVTAPERQGKYDVILRRVRVTVSVKRIRITYCYCVSEALVIQHVKRMFLVIICGMSSSIIFSTLSDPRHAFRKRYIDKNLRFDVLYNQCLRYFQLQKEFNEILSQMHIGLRVM